MSDGSWSRADSGNLLIRLSDRLRVRRDLCRDDRFIPGAELGVKWAKKKHLKKVWQIIFQIGNTVTWAGRRP